MSHKIKLIKLFSLKYAVLIALLLLSGCASKAPKATRSLTEAERPAWEAHRDRVQNIQHWYAKGRMAAKKGSEGGQAHFTWEQQPNLFDISIFGPFGAGHVNIKGNSRWVELTDQESRQYRANSPTELFHQVAGWSVPIEGLRYWLLGVPSPLTKVQFERFDEQGQLAILIQDGWEIHFERYEKQPIALPTKIKLTNQDASVKVIIQSWQSYA